MRRLTLVALSSLPLLLLAAQDPQDDKVDLRDPLRAFREDESARIEKELQGAWILLDYANPAVVIDQQDVRGFVMFHGGYMTLSLQARENVPGRFGPQKSYTVQSGAYRYRIEDGQHLQTDGVVGFISAEGTNGFDFHSVLQPTEYEVRVAAGELSLTRIDHRTFTFRRLEPSEFSASSIEKLHRLRAGADIEDAYEDVLGGGR